MITVNSKNCIFHVPYKINHKVKSGTNIRPIKIIEGLKNNGYNVEVVEGYGKERKNSIENIKRNIKNGVKYDFLYSESSTMPTLLTEKNHLPKYPFLDFGFLKYCSKENIPIGLFYRDIHWKFPQYKNQVNILKQVISKLFYEYDLKRYKELVDVLYLPSMEMFKYLNLDFTGKIENLPPGSDESEGYCIKEKENKDIIKIFYVGGINEELYNLKLLFEVVNENKNLYLTVCCRENEWKANEKEYSKFLNNRIEIIHKDGKEVYNIAKNFDIMNLYIKPTGYWEFAMPLKLFTYIGYRKPILSVEDTVAGDFVSKKNIGWQLGYNKDKLSEFFYNISKNEIAEKEQNISKVLEENTWDCRAQKIIEDLSKL